MQEILILNTGGTFNKVYNQLLGHLEVSKNSDAIGKIVDVAFRENVDITIKGVLFKDSLELTLSSFSKQSGMEWVGTNPQTLIWLGRIEEARESPGLVKWESNSITIAASWAMIGEPDDAFRSLNRLLPYHPEFGDCFIRSDVAFGVLREDPRWPDLITQLDQNESRLRELLGRSKVPE